MLNQDIPDEFYDVVEMVARQVQRKWPDLDWEDIRQDMWVYLLERPTQMRLMVNESDDRIRMLRKIASECAQTQAKLNETAWGQYNYGTKHVRAMLEAGFLVDDTVGTLAEQHDFVLGISTLQNKNVNYHAILLQRFNQGVVTHDRKSVTRAIDKLTEYMNQSRVSTMIGLEELDENEFYEMNTDEILNRIMREGSGYATSR